MNTYDAHDLCYYTNSVNYVDYVDLCNIFYLSHSHFSYVHYCRGIVQNVIGLAVRFEYKFILIICIIVQVTAFLKTLEFQESTQRSGHFALYNCSAGSNGFTTIHFPPDPSTAVITWTWSWLGSRVSIMVPLLCCEILSGTLGFCFCSQHLLWLTLDPSPSNAHLYCHWKHTTILRMVIISIISDCGNYIYYTN